MANHTKETSHKHPQNGRAHKTTECEDVELGKNYSISDEYRRRRERNNVAARKSREKGKLFSALLSAFSSAFISARKRHHDLEIQLVNLSQENSALKDAVKRSKHDLEQVKADYELLYSSLYATFITVLMQLNK